MRAVSLIFICLTGCANMGCAQEMFWSSILSDIRSKYPDVERISVDSLANWMTNPERSDPVLLDVREPDEYAVSHLQDALRIDPDTDSLSELNDLPRDTPIVAYCSVGYRSSTLAEKLKEAGFTNVANLEGSIFKWANQGHPVYRSDSLVTEVHPYNSVWGQLLKPDLRRYE